MSEKNDGVVHEEVDEGREQVVARVHDQITQTSPQYTFFLTIAWTLVT